MLIVVGVLIGLLTGAAVAFFALHALTGSRLAAARRTRQLLIAEGKREAEALRREAQLEAKEEAVKFRSKVERELNERRAELLKLEERAATNAEELARRHTELERREQGVTDR